MRTKRSSNRARHKEDGTGVCNHPAPQSWTERNYFVRQQQLVAPHMEDRQKPIIMACAADQHTRHGRGTRPRSVPQKVRITNNAPQGRWTNGHNHGMHSKNQQQDAVSIDYAAPTRPWRCAATTPTMQHPTRKMSRPRPIIMKCVTQTSSSAPHGAWTAARVQPIIMGRASDQQTPHKEDDYHQ